MKPAQGKPAHVIPAAPGKRRQVSPAITTSWLTTAGVVKAVYEHETPIAAYTDSPCYATLRYAIPSSGTATQWYSTTRLEAVSRTEIGALDSLFQTLQELPEILEETWVAAVPVWRALEYAAGDATTPWALQPLGVRGLKPRRHRTWWNDPTRPGKQIPIYPDLMRPHVDPNCQCVHCKNHITPTRTTKKKK